MLVSEVLGAIVAIFSISALVGAFVYDTLNKSFLADKQEKQSHLMAVTGRVNDMENSVNKKLDSFSKKFEAISESNGQMMKTMLDAEERYNEAQNDETFSIRSTLESLGETVKSLKSQLDRQKPKKSVKKSGKRK